MRLRFRLARLLRQWANRLDGPQLVAHSVVNGRTVELAITAYNLADERRR